eukprot:548799_1
MSHLNTRALILLILLVLMINGEFLTLNTLQKMNTFKVFQEWKLEYNRVYNGLEEESIKYSIWSDNMELIANHNSKNLSYKMGINQFGDMTHKEFKSYIGSCSITSFKSNDISITKISDIDEITHMNAPASVNWTAKGVVTPVKNQGGCGSCWAFGATGAMECNYAIKHGKLTSLSEEQIIDCGHPNSNGCNGGNSVSAMNYAASEGGLCTEKAYPYTAGETHENGTCKVKTCGTKYDAPNKSNPVTKIQHNNSTALMEAVVKGCVQVNIEADQPAFQHYKSGVITSGCGADNDHSVLTVGYGTENGVQYWLVKNSWGQNWGDNGYVKICRNCKQNTPYGECGILKGPSQPNY